MNYKDTDEDFWEESGSTYRLHLWISTNKTLDELEKSLSSIISPIPIQDDVFSIGGIRCEILDANGLAPQFRGVPSHNYAFCIVIPIVDYLIWGCIDRQFVYALTMGLRTTFECQYLLTKWQNGFIMYSGTNLPKYINLLYQPWHNKWAHWRTPDDIELEVPNERPGR